MKIDVFMIGLRHINATQGGIETHVRHLANELAFQGLNVSIAVRKREVARSRRQATGGQHSGEEIGTGLERRAKRPSGTGADDPLPALPTGVKQQGMADTIRIIPIWSPRIVALDAVFHSLLCVLYAAIFLRPRIVHIHAIGPGIVAPLARLLGLRVVATHHGQDYRREKWGMLARAVLRFGEWMQAKSSAAIICVSRSLRDTLTNRYDRDYIYVPNGVHPPAGSAPPKMLETLGLKPGGYILSVGRLVPEKRHGDLIDAFLAIKEMPDMKLVIVGEGRCRYADWLKRKAAHAPDVVMAGFRDGAELEALYAHALVFALPSSHEGLPIVLLEAMAHGCEVVVSDIAPHRELGLSSGRYHAVGDIQSLSARIANVALRAMLKNQRCDWSSVLHHHRWSPIAQKTVEIFRSIDPQIGRGVVAKHRMQCLISPPSRLDQNIAVISCISEGRREENARPRWRRHSKAPRTAEPLSPDQLID